MPKKIGSALKTEPHFNKDNQGKRQQRIKLYFWVVIIMIAVVFLFYASLKYNFQRAGEKSKSPVFWQELKRGISEAWGDFQKQRDQVSELLNVENWRELKDEKAGWSVKYPPGWRYSLDDFGQGAIFISSDGQEEVALYKQLVSHQVPVEQIEKAEINNLRVEIIKSTLAKDGQPVDYAIFTKEDGEKYEIRGYGPNWQSIWSTFKFIQPAAADNINNINLNESD